MSKEREKKKKYYPRQRLWCQVVHLSEERVVRQVDTLSNKLLSTAFGERLEFTLVTV